MDPSPRPWSGPGIWVARLTARPASPFSRRRSRHCGHWSRRRVNTDLVAFPESFGLDTYLLGLMRNLGDPLSSVSRTEMFPEDVGFSVLNLGQSWTTCMIVTQGSLPCLGGFQWLQFLCLPRFRYRVSPRPTKVSNSLMAGRPSSQGQLQPWTPEVLSVVL